MMRKPVCFSHNSISQVSISHIHYKYAQLQWHRHLSISKILVLSYSSLFKVSAVPVSLFLPLISSLSYYPQESHEYSPLYSQKSPALQNLYIPFCEPGYSAGTFYLGNLHSNFLHAHSL